MKYRSLAFDFDGTLADTLDEGLKIYNRLAGEYGSKIISPDELPLLRDMKLNEFLRHIGVSRRHVPKLLIKGTKILKSRIASLPLINGIEPVLRELRGHCEQFGILTSNSVENVNLFLESHQLKDTFTFVSSTSKLTGKAKHLRSINRTFSMAPGELVYVGDEIRDIKAAQKAKVPIAAVTWGFNSEKSLTTANPDHLFHTPEELLKLV